MNFEDIGKYLLRFLSRGPKYHGTIILKYYDGKIANAIADDSFDIKYLNSLILNIEENDMLIKTGSPVNGDIKSSKINTQVEIKDKKIIKESNIKENEDTKKQ